MRNAKKIELKSSTLELLFCLQEHKPCTARVETIMQQKKEKVAQIELVTNANGAKCDIKNRLEYHAKSACSS